MIEKPNRYRNAVVPHIYVDGAATAIAFYTRAFGAVELFRVARADGKILHAEIAIAESVVMIGDPTGQYYGDPLALGRCTTSLHLFVDDNVQFLRRAVEAGAETIQPPTDMFYGANSASVRDPFGHVWVLLSWQEDLEPAEMERRGNDLLREDAPLQKERHGITAARRDTQYAFRHGMAAHRLRHDLRGHGAAGPRLAGGARHRHR